MFRVLAFLRTARRLTVLTGIVGALLAVVYAGLSLQSGVRAYVAGESQWSKAQKRAVNALHRYAASGTQADFDAFAAYLAVPRADRVARLEMERPRGDLLHARRALVAAGNAPADVTQMIFLFRHFGWVGPFRDAIAVWRMGDVEIARLERDAARLRATTMAHGPLSPPARAALAAVDRTDDRLTVLEQAFSTALGEGARLTGWIAMLVALTVGAALVAIGGALLERFDRHRRRATEAELARAQEARVLIENAPDIIARFDGALRHTYVNGAVEHVLGVRPEALIGRTPAELALPAEVRDVIQERLRAVFASGAPDEGTLRVPTVHGSKWLHVRLAPEMDATGTVTSVLAVSRDMTAQQRAADAMRESEARYRLLFEASPRAVWVYDVETLRFLAVNQAALREYGYTREEFLGMTLRDIRPDEDVAIVEHDVATTPDGYNPASAWRHRHKDGAVVQVEITSHSLTFDGRRARLVLVTDVTERRRLEAELTRQALHDPLTGLANRTLFRQRVERAIVRTGPPHGGVAVLYIDVDNFKTVNDSLGHAAGDRLLVAVAERLLGGTRGCDTVARLGGDEFAVLLENVRAGDDVVIVAERITTVMRRPVALDGREVRVGVSVGVARRQAEEDADALCRNADLAMYTAKAKGKGCYALFEAAMHAAMLNRLDRGASSRRGTISLGR